MPDPFAPVIASTMTLLGYQCQTVAMPKYRDYDPAQPTLYISPVGKPSVFWIAFQTVSVRQAYDLVYVYPNSLTETIGNNDVWGFKNDVINQFQGLIPNMDGAGASNTTARDVSDYNRPLFKTGYTYSQIQVLVDYIQK